MRSICVIIEYLLNMILNCGKHSDWIFFKTEQKSILSKWYWFRTENLWQSLSILRKHIFFFILTWNVHIRCSVKGFPLTKHLMPCMHIFQWKHLSVVCLWLFWYRISTKQKVGTSGLYMSLSMFGKWVYFQSTWKEIC